MKFDTGASTPGLSTLLSNFKLAVKFNWIISFLRFEGGSEKITEIRAG